MKEGSQRHPNEDIWVVLKIMVPFWVPIIIRPLILGYPKGDHNFDNPPYVYVKGRQGSQLSGPSANLTEAGSHETKTEASFLVLLPTQANLWTHGSLLNQDAKPGHKNFREPSSEPTA